jgi:hypothetical protein
MTPTAAKPIIPAAPPAYPGPPAANQTSRSGLPGGGWYGKKLVLLVALAFLVHLVLICFFGTKTRIVPRRVSHVPRLQLADDGNPMTALEDPTLFALPNRKDFSSVSWSKVPVITEPSFQWNESPRWLGLETNHPEATFETFALAPARLELAEEVKPPPPVTGTPARLGGAMPAGSSLNIPGDLASRGLLSTVDLPSLPYDNVIPASRIQVLVDASGQIVSAVLLPPTDSTEAVERCDAADQLALVIARQLRFVPARQLNVGEIDFCWQAVPVRLNHSPTGL